mgnify:CR=1 FL=1
MARRQSKSRLILTFFGLSKEYRKKIFKDIHEICFYGQGGYDWDTVYSMPIWLRKYTYKEIESHYIKRQETIDEKNNVVTNTTNISKISKPPINSPNTYTSKVSKK